MKGKRSLLAGCLLVAILSLSAQNICAHPSWGIVVTKSGTVFFADILHCDNGCVWKVDRDGSLSRFISNQHSHMLYLDKEENLWGTHHEYISRSDEWESLLWRIDNSGTRTTVIPPTRDLSKFGGVNFAIDKHGDIYFNHKQKILKCKPGGEAVVFAGGAPEMRDGKVNTLAVVQE